MGDLKRAILGGLAGGFEASGEIMDDRLKESLDLRKQEALLKKQKNLAFLNS